MGGHRASCILTSETSHRSVSALSFDGKRQIILTFCLVSKKSKMFHFAEVKMFHFDLIISICVSLASEADENTSSKMGMCKSIRYISV